MEWIDYVYFEPKSKEEIIWKLTNDGYTFPCYDKKNNCVKFSIDIVAIRKDCNRVGIPFNAVYPLQLSLF